MVGGRIWNERPLSLARRCGLLLLPLPSVGQQMLGGARGPGSPVPSSERKVNLMSPISPREERKYSSVVGVMARGLCPHSDAQRPVRGDYTQGGS